MNANPYAILVNLLGFITGGLLYGMLLLMVLREARDAYTSDSNTGRENPSRDRLPLVTAILGLGWNVVAFVVYGLPGLGVSNSYPLLVAAAFTALGFLPAVVVHSVLRTAKSLSADRGAFWMTATAYTLSGITERDAICLGRSRQQRSVAGCSNRADDRLSRADPGIAGDNPTGPGMAASPMGCGAGGIFSLRFALEPSRRQ
ncbi:MAG TPA: hypothetical protein VEZ90_02350 [Blastocatellia bacterium]|nr:hypothetical protein [Blastocatellia bacterium]